MDDTNKISPELPNNNRIPKTPEIINTLVAIANPLDKCLNTSFLNTFSNDKKLLDSSVHGHTTIQNMRSQLIKEGLKITLQKKRGIESPLNMTFLHNCDSVEDNETKDYGNHIAADSNPDSDIELNLEDKDVQYKRRERNKIAAIKCRLKKKEKTVNLVQESECLENQNRSLKSQIKELEIQRRRLVDMLNVHKPNCMRNFGKKSDISRLFLQSTPFS